MKHKWRTMHPSHCREQFNLVCDYDLHFFYIIFYCFLCKLSCIIWQFLGMVLFNTYHSCGNTCIIEGLGHIIIYGFCMEKIHIGQNNLVCNRKYLTVYGNWKCRRETEFRSEKVWWFIRWNKTFDIWRLYI